MATLINRECWHVGATLRHGTIIDHDIKSAGIPLVTVRFDDGSKQKLAAASVWLHPSPTAQECRNNAEYWTRKANELQALDDMRQDAII